MTNRPTIAALALSALVSTLAGCGYSEDQWKAQLAKYDELQRTSAAREAEREKEIAAQKARIADLEKQLQAAGYETSKLAITLQDRDKALAEYKLRAKQLEAIRARFELLRKKLDDLTRIGLAVHIRHNRMVISLPGDVLFDTGKDTLKKEGENILKKVAVVLRVDKTLAERDYQVGGHTDNQPLSGGPFRDNWGLSLMRARAVLVFLIGSQGNLSRQHWSAAGFADTDPVAPNTTQSGQQKNRRCDLVVVPDVDEMIDLRVLAGH